MSKMSCDIIPLNDLLGLEAFYEDSRATRDECRLVTSLNVYNILLAVSILVVIVIAVKLLLPKNRRKKE